MTQPLIEFLISYFTLGVFIGTICVTVQYNIFRPFVQLELVGWIISVVLWPVAIVTTILAIIKRGV